MVVPRVFTHPPAPCIKSLLSEFRHRCYVAKCCGLSALSLSDMIFHTVVRSFLCLRCRVWLQKKSNAFKAICFHAALEVNGKSLHDATDNIRRKNRFMCLCCSFLTPCKLKNSTWQNSGASNKCKLYIYSCPAQPQLLEIKMQRTITTRDRPKPPSGPSNIMLST